jgi:hypothetical protein
MEVPLVLRDLNPGRKKYGMRHVVAILNRQADSPDSDELMVRTVVGVLLPERWSIKILCDLPIELPGQPYQDFFMALQAAANLPLDGN